ncbi:hypothetical protein CVT25_001584 [Psilocybe cyanescens]|uniref:Uncharacterized protein n=1 Tax=Psilocybe cyanescens TaxID=93625 RepID=A0A409WPY8_PSICY|nr:hypothetical protein CVT25_001584 [Psilocybe cyanescens]
MSQYANAVLAPLTTAAYYQRPGSATNADGSIAPIPLAPAQCQQHQSWPQYFTEHHALPQSSRLPSYGTSSDPPSSTSACMPYASSSAAEPFVNPVEDASHFHQPQQIFNAQSRSLDYQITPQPLSAPYYPTSSQRTIITPPSPQSSTFPLSYGFRNNRDSSPSSHTSTSDFEVDSREWDSPVYRSEDLSHQLSYRDAPEDDKSTGQVGEAGSRDSSSPESTTTSVTTHPSVKIEPDDPDGCFIMELTSLPDLSEDFGQSIFDRTIYKSNLLSQSLAPPTEVPLRATQASKEMRGMMGVFRLNPFAMHSLSMNGDGSDSPSGLEGGKAHALWGGEAHPLDEEPLVFEFQLNINGPDGEAEEDSTNGTERESELASLGIRNSQGLDATDQLRSFSPSFSLHPDDIDVGSVSPRDRRSITRIPESEYDDDDREEDCWPEAVCGSRSEVDTSSTTTRSIHTPFNDSPLQDIQARPQGVFEPHHDQSHNSPSSCPWDAVNEQYYVDDHQFTPSITTALSEIPKVSMDYGHEPMRIPRLHTSE